MLRTNKILRYSYSNKTVYVTLIKQSFGYDGIISHVVSTYHIFISVVPAEDNCGILDGKGCEVSSSKYSS